MNKTSDFFKELFYKIGIYSFAKKVFTRPYIKYLSLQFKLSGNETVKRFLFTMNSNNYHYWLEFGTLLGAIRENKILSHDADIDVAMFSENWSDNIAKDLNKQGFNLKKRASLHTGEIIEETYTYKFSQVDIFYAFKDQGKIILFDYMTFDGLSPIQCMKQKGGLKVYKKELTNFHFKPYSFYNNTVLIPENYDLHLKELYGENYMIPNKNWTNDKDGIRTPTEYLAKIEYF